MVVRGDQDKERGVEGLLNPPLNQEDQRSYEQNEL